MSRFASKTPKRQRASICPLGNASLASASTQLHKTCIEIDVSKHTSKMASDQQPTADMRKMLVCRKGLAAKQLLPISYSDGLGLTGIELANAPMNVIEKK